MPIYDWSIDRHKNRLREQMRGMQDALNSMAVSMHFDYYGVAVQRGTKVFEMLTQTVDTLDPHIILMQVHVPNVITPEHIRRLKEVYPHILVLNWNGDVYPESQLVGEGLELSKAVDLHLSVNGSVVTALNEQGIPAEYWQIGYEPLMLPGDDRPEVEAHDVVFLGGGYSEKRIEIARAMEASGADFALYGAWNGEFNADGECYYDFKTQGQIYRAAKLTIGDQQWPDQIGYVSNRIFNALAAGGALLLQQNFDGCEKYTGLKDGVHFVGWDKSSDLPKLIKHWISPKRAKEREKIVRAGQEYVLANCSFEMRLKELFTEILPRRFGGNDD